MSLPVVYLPEAQNDVDEAYAAYEQRVVGLGERFLEVLQDQVDRIQAKPALYGVVYQDVRAAPLRQFPYVVYYRVETDQIVVIAVQHGRRSSRAWQGRV
jgi:toxin ParE1/3/4